MYSFNYKYNALGAGGLFFPFQKRVASKRKTQGTVLTFLNSSLCL